MRFAWRIADCSSRVGPRSVWRVGGAPVVGENGRRARDARSALGRRAASGVARRRRRRARSLCAPARRSPRCAVREVRYPYCMRGAHSNLYGTRKWKEAHTAQLFAKTARPSLRVVQCAKSLRGGGGPGSRMPSLAHMHLSPLPAGGSGCGLRGAPQLCVAIIVATSPHSAHSMAMTLESAEAVGLPFAAGRAGGGSSRETRRIQAGA